MINADVGKYPWWMFPIHITTTLLHKLVWLVLYIIGYPVCAIAGLFVSKDIITNHPEPLRYPRWAWLWDSKVSTTPESWFWDKDHWSVQAGDRWALWHWRAQRNAVKNFQKLDSRRRRRHCTDH